MVAVAAAVGLIVLTACTSGSPPPSSMNTPVPADLNGALAAIENQEKYAASDWGYIALDQQTGEVLVAENADKMFDPGSTMKSFAVAAALDAYGRDHTFVTPVYRSGTVANGTLDGNLVLVGAGDLSFGLREQANGTLAYENMPALDHSYATVGVPGAVEPPGNPLAVLDEFAAQVKASGINTVNGEIVVDDRMFTPIQWPDGLISPIWVNENLIDIMVSPGAAQDDPTSMNWRPQTSSYTVESRATTVPPGGETALRVTETSPGRLVVEGTIAAGSDPRLVVHEIDDPSAFARTAFIEALRRAGVTVTATPAGPNPASELPAVGSYREADRVASHTSASLGNYVQLIMKVSYNRGADLMTCIAAVKASSTDCKQGLVSEVDVLTRLGVDKNAVYIFDGAGSDDHNRTTPRALAEFYKGVAGTSYAGPFYDSLPILGKDGTLANVLADSPVAGKARLKTGNRAIGTEAGQMILLGNSLAGYVEAASGRRLVVTVAMGNMPFESFAEFETVTADQARMVELIQQAY